DSLSFISLELEIRGSLHAVYSLRNDLALYLLKKHSNLNVEWKYADDR
ncbi:unnamed protein product, partial [Amoebophrya sp. A25]